MLTAEPVTLSALLEHFYRDQLKKVRVSQDEWNQLVQNMVAFQHAQIVRFFPFLPNVRWWHGAAASDPQAELKRGQRGR